LQGATEPFSLEVARIAREKFDSTWAIAESGAAGPDANRYGDPPGHAAIAVVGPTEHAVTLRTGVDGRCENMQRFAEAALDLLGTALRRRRE
jgi:nicotinamide mononucleotide (NMN) deamidase PncC